MTTQTLPRVRRLMVDLHTPFARHWLGNDPFRTAFFDALSMSFPAGEQFFIDSVKRGVDALPVDLRIKFEAEVRAFIGQEATHRFIHDQFNRQRAKGGLVNHWEGRIRRRRQSIERQSATLWLGATAASEHFTALLSEYLLARPDFFVGTEDRLRDFWLWHASEESEHRCTAFELFRAAGGSEAMRRYTFVFVTIHFLTDALRQTVNNLWHDGTLFSWRTWLSGGRFLFGRDGLITKSFVPWCRYLRKDFDPEHTGGLLGRGWLDEHLAMAVPLPVAGSGEVVSSQATSAAL